MDKAHTKNNSVQIRLSESDRMMIDALRGCGGFNLSEFVRRKIQEEYKSKIKSQGITAMRIA